jgi:hypothetical protein
VRPLRVITLAVLVLLALGGFAGGLAFLTDPSGGRLGITVDELPAWPLPEDYTPLLADYTVPGITLILLFGLLPIAAVVQLARYRASGWTLTAVVGLLLLGWMVGQIVAIGLTFPAMQAGFLVVGIVLIGLGVDGAASVGTSDESQPAVQS